MKILIVGGSGFVGRNLSHLLSKEHDITILTRGISEDKKLPDVKYVYDILKGDNYDIIINLSGARLNAKRWSEEFKKEIYESRVVYTKKLLKKLVDLHISPQLYIAASAIGIYGHRGSDILDETSEAEALNFSANLCKDLESEAEKFTKLGCKLAIARFGVILGDDGFLPEILPSFKLGLGAVMGSGEEWFSWIHIKDAISAIKHIIDNNLEGKFNIVSPNPVTNKYFSHKLAKALKRPIFLKLPKWLIKLLFGQMGEELILSSIKVTPKRLLETNFKFNYSDISDAIDNVLSDF